MFAQDYERHFLLPGLCWNQKVNVHGSLKRLPFEA